MASAALFFLSVRFSKLPRNTGKKQQSFRPIRTAKGSETRSKSKEFYMFTSIKNRIVRTIAAVVIASVSIGLSASTARADWGVPQLAPAPVRLTYAGQTGQDTVIMTVGFPGGSTIAGTITINGSTYSYEGYMQGANISGVMIVGGYQLPFTGVNPGCEVYLTIHGHQFHLQPVMN
jgi:hypothetical protein